MLNCFVKCFKMKIFQLQIYLLIWSQTAETLTDRLTDFGQNVTIKCDLREEDVYWFLLKLPHPPVMILRTFSSPFYYNERFINKYSVQSKNHLFINNVTHDELGVYYCMNPETKSKEFSNGTRLHIIEIPEKQKNSVTNPDDILMVRNPQWLVIMSALMNGVLLIVIIGLAVVLVKRNRKGFKHLEDIEPQELMNLEQLRDFSQTQYVLVTFPTPCKRF